MLSADFRSVNATAIVLVRADREKRQYVYTYFTPEMLVYTPGGYRSLSWIYSNYGTEQLAEYVNAMTGLRIDYTFTVEGFRMDELVKILGMGELTAKLEVEANAFSKTAEEAIKAVGGNAIII